MMIKIRWVRYLPTGCFVNGNTENQYEQIAIQDYFIHRGPCGAVFSGAAPPDRLPRSPWPCT